MQQQKLLDDHLNWLEAESIYIIREVVAQCANPAMLFSGGKDSIVMFHLARKAFQFGNRPIKLPFPIVHIDTGHNYPEVIAYRDAVVKQTGVQTDRYVQQRAFETLEDRKEVDTLNICDVQL